jgi:hypothetical protein
MQAVSDRVIAERPRNCATIKFVGEAEMRTFDTCSETINDDPTDWVWRHDQYNAEMRRTGEEQ